MNYGRYFALDTGRSRLNKGIVFFNYLELKETRPENLKNETPEYPISLMMTRELIEFSVHYFSNGKENEEIKHQNISFLSLPISDDLEIKDQLTTALIDAYDMDFPRKDPHNNYLYDLVMDKKKEEESLKAKGDLMNPSYSSLNIWGKPMKKDIFSFFKTKKSVEAASGEEQKAEKINWFVRKLLLDFLYDLEYTEVFKHSPYYEYISIKLKENFLLKSILCKTQFYYCKALINTKLLNKSKADKNKQNSDKEIIDKEVLFLCYYYFLPAEEQWGKMIRSPHSDKNFVPLERDLGEKPFWFENPEKEMKSVLKKESTIKAEQGEEKKINVANCGDLYHLLKKQGKWKSEAPAGILKAIRKRAKNEMQLSYIWLVKKYAFWTGYPHGFLSFFFLFWVFTTVMTIFLPGLLSVFLPILIIILVIVFFYYWGKAKLDPDINSFGFSLNVSFVLPRLIAAIFTAWFTLTFSEDLYRIFFDARFSPGIVIALLGATFIFIMSEIKKGVPYIGIWERRYRTVYLLLITYFYAFIIGFFIVLTTGNKFLERNSFLEQFYREYVFSGTQKYQWKGEINEFIMAKYKDEKYSPRTGKILVESSAQNAYCVQMNKLQQSCGIRFMLTNPLHEDSGWSNYTINSHLVKKVVDIDKNPDDLREWYQFLKTNNNNILYRDCLKYLYRDGIPILKEVSYMFCVKDTLNILPLFLYHFTFVVMFIGVFIQLIFEQRSIME